MKFNKALRNLKVKTKIIIMAVFMLLVMVLLAGTAMLNQYNHSKTNLEDMEARIRSSYDLNIKNQVENAISLINTIYNRQVAGDYTEEEAKKLAADLIREIRATWSRKAEHTEAEVLDYFGELDLLIIEEIGTGAGSEDEKARIFQVINRRYEAMLPTILVSNFDLKALEQEIGSRVLDRLREGDRAVLTFDWPSMRGAV